MSTREITFISSDLKIRASFKSASAAPQTIVPTLNFSFEVSMILPSNQNFLVRLNDLGGVVEIIDKNHYVYYVSRLFSKPGYPLLGQGSFLNIQLSAELDYYKLKKIEEIRNGEDLHLTFDLYIEGEKEGEPQTKQLTSITSIEAKIPKSEWVEQILPKLGYKDVFLVEVPKIKDGGFAKVAKYLESAWKEYMSGKYDAVLIDCRRTLEELKTKMKKLGLTRMNEIKKENNEVEKEEVIDWKKLNVGNNTADILDSMFRKSLAFTAPAAHAGKAINKEDGDFALLVTNALVSYTIEKIDSIKKLENGA